MSLLDSLGLGMLMGQNQTQSNHSAQYGSQSAMNQSLVQQQLRQYSQMRNQTKWMFDGIPCSGPREMADIIWPNDCAEKTHFLLKYE